MSQKLKFIIRSSKGIETRTQSYYRATDDKTIIMVGAMHIAVQEYWDDVISYLQNADSEGFDIHLEGVQPAQEGATEQEKKGIAVVQALIKFSSSMGELTGLVYQKDAFSVAPKWEAHDLTVLDVVRGMDEKLIDFLADIPMKSLGISPKRAVWAFKNIASINIIGFFIPYVRRLLRALIDNRNKFAIATAIAEPKDVVLFWGAAHLPGMHKLLVAEGFVQTGSSWRVVIPASYEASEPSIEVVV